MTQPHPAALPHCYPPEVEHLREDFEESWQSGTPPPFERFLTASAAPCGARQREFLEDLVRIDMEYRWRLSPPASAEDRIRQRPRLEDYVARFPLLGRLDQQSVEFIGVEYWIRQRWGDHPSHDEYAVRFPGKAAALRAALAEIDQQLAVEFARNENPLPPFDQNTKPAPGVSPPRAVPAVTSMTALLATLRRAQLLEPAELDQLAQILATTTLEVRGLGRELLKRGWLTPFQVNHLLQGRGEELVLGPYLLLERLGAGGVGQVFKARHQPMRRVVALKLIRQELLTDTEVVARFYREIQVVSRLSHPHIVHAFDAGPCGATHLLAMEYVAGTDLAKLVKESGPLSVPEACMYIRQAALGLQHAHERGLVHRDLKPPNILLLAQKAAGAKPPAFRVAKIADFGLARLRQPVVADDLTRAARAGTDSSLLTAEGAVMMGTPDYMAPEQAEDFHGADIRADIYSLGCTLYFLLTGGPPFPGGSLAEKITRHFHRQPAPVATFRSDLPSGVQHVLDRMLAKQPDHRFQTPAEVAAALGDPGLLTTALLSVPARGNEPNEQPSERTAVIASGSCANVGQLPVGIRRRMSRRWFLAGAAGLLLSLVGLWKVKLAGEQGSPRKPEDAGSREEKDSRQAWLDEVRRLSPKEQVKRVQEKLMELNPHFDGKLWPPPQIEYGAVTSLSLCSDNVTDLSPVAALSDLKSLACGGSAPGQGSLADLTPLAGLKLESLVCRNTKVTDAGLQALAGLKQLKTLDLHETGVTDAGLKEVAGLQQLKTLNLNGTQVTDAGLKELVALQQLQDISLAACKKVTDAGLKTLARLQQLKTLNLYFVKVTNAGLKELAGLQQLTTLELGGTQVSDAGLKYLAGLKQLTTLGFLGTQQVTDAGLKELAGLQQLTTLQLGGTQVTDAGLAELAGLKAMKTLSLRLTQVTGTGLKKLTGLKDLHWLDLRETKVTDVGLKDLAELKNLHWLGLSGTKVTDAGLKDLADLKNLHTLHLSGTKVTDAGLRELAGLKGLQCVELRDTKVTDGGAAALKKALPNLQLVR